MWQNTRYVRIRDKFSKYDEEVPQGPMKLFARVCTEHIWGYLNIKLNDYGNRWLLNFLKA